MGRIGMHGFSGHHAEDRHTQDAVLLVDAALDELKRRHGFQKFALSGFSSGEQLVANLLSQRSDIRCAVIASAPLDLALYYQGQDGIRSNYFAMHRGELADPMRTVQSIRRRQGVRHRRRPRPERAACWLGGLGGLGGGRAAQGLARLRRRRRWLRPPGAEGTGRPIDMTGVRSLEAAHACAAGAPGEEARRALVAGEPILRPRGRRLEGEEIKATFAGRRLAGYVWPHWGTRVTLLILWDADGQRSEFHPAHPERPVGAAQRWWVEDDRLCTTDDGCNAVLADERFLHVVKGEPPRFLMTFAVAPPGG